MNTRMQPGAGVRHEDLEETAELPILDTEGKPVLEAVAQPAAAPAAPRPDTEAEARDAEIGSLRNSLATATETRGQLEGSLQKLTANLRDLEERLHRKSDQLSLFEREVGARDRHIAELEAGLKARDDANRALEGERDAQVAELAQLRQELAAARDARRRAEEEHAALRQVHALGEARIAQAEADSAEHQRRSERYREQLQSLEGRRQIFDAMLGEREQLLAERDARVAQLEREAAERAQHAGVRESDLVAELGAATQRAAGLAAELEHARGEIEALTRRAEQARIDADARLAAAEQRIHELDRAVAAAAHDAGVREGEIHARLAAEQGRAQELSAALDAARAEHAAMLEATRAERAALEQQHIGAQQRLTALEAESQEYGEMLRTLHEQLASATGRAETLSSDLLAAEDRIRTLETDLRARDVSIERLERAEREARARADDIGRSLEERNQLIGRLEAEAASSAAVLGSIQQNLERFGQDGAPAGGDASAAAEDSAQAAHAAADAHLPLEQIARLLVRTEGDSGIVHVLGRRTSIGRTADNDLRIDAESVSRHHAVVLATTTGTVIEDLHSTNGVFVNGVRVSRQRLHEGDLVTIGRAEFRYVTKPVGERAVQ